MGLVGGGVFLSWKRGEKRDVERCRARERQDKTRRKRDSMKMKGERGWIWDP